jgi:hypothetical protein
LVYNSVLFFYGSWLIDHYLDTYSGGRKPTNIAGEYLVYQLIYDRTSLHGCGVEKKQMFISGKEHGFIITQM